MRKTGILQGGSIEGREKAAAKKGQFSFLKFHKSIYIFYFIIGEADCYMLLNVDMKDASRTMRRSRFKGLQSGKSFEIKPVGR